MKAVRTLSLLALLALTTVALHGAEAPSTSSDAAELTTDMTHPEAAGTPTLRSPAKGRASARSVSQLADAVTEISASLDRLQSLVVGAIGLGLINILLNAMVLLSWLRRSDSRKSAQDETGEDETPVEPTPVMTPPPGDQEPAPVTPVQDDSPTPDPPLSLRAMEVPTSRPVETREKPQRPSDPDEFAVLPHAAIGRALSQLHRALPDLARKIPDPRQQERFLAELDLPLKARVERFKEAASRGDAYLKEHWIEQDLVTTLNTLSQMLSSVIEERHRGRRGNRVLEDELLSWLYEKLAPVCRAEGWFAVESILPFTTRFDPKIHHSLGSVALNGADNLIVAVKAIGRRDAQKGFVTHKAEVIVGR